MNVNKELMDKLSEYPVNARIAVRYNNDDMVYIERVTYDPVNNTVEVQVSDTPF